MSHVFSSGRLGVTRLRHLTVPTLILLLSGVPLYAQAPTQAPETVPDTSPDPSFLLRARDASSAARQSLSVLSAASRERSDAAVASANAQAAGQPLHVAAVEHSPGYETRARIHRYASLAMLPLFGTEVLLGQSLYNGQNGDAKRGVHAAVGGGIVGLFAVNTVTGAWNMFGEGRQDPNNKKLRLLHGLLMMAADAGFMATEASAPEGEGARGGVNLQNRKMTHRNLALISMSVGTAGYLTMLFGNR